MSDGPDSNRAADGPGLADDRWAAFPWPCLPGQDTPPRRVPGGFSVAGRTEAVLRYARGDAAGWSDELTALHEDAAGSRHPIDMASRRLAVTSLAAAGEAPLVLEVGCSSGFLADTVAAALPGARMICSDYVDGGLRKLAERRPEVACLQFDLTACPLPDACVDAVVALNVLEHIEDDARAVREVARILKPGGIAHFEVPAGADLYDGYDRFLQHHRRYAGRQLAGLAQAAGLRVTRLTHLGFLPYPLFRRAKRRNQRQGAGSASEMRDRVVRQVRATASSRLMRSVLALELRLGRIWDFPCGIRCICVCQRT